MKPIIAVLCPMPMEFAAVEKAIGLRGENLDFGFEEKSVALENANLIIARCGIGKTFAAAKAQKIILTYKPSHIFVCGVAGAIDEKLELFDVVVPGRVVHGDIKFGEEYCPSGVTESARGLFEASPAYTKDGFLTNRLDAPQKSGTLATLDCFAEESEKDFLEEKFGAVCIDMESAAIMQIATMENIPVTVIRAFSDTRKQTFGDFETNAPKACDAAAAVLVELLKKF